MYVSEKWLKEESIGMVDLENKYEDYILFRKDYEHLWKNES